MMACNFNLKINEYIFNSLIGTKNNKHFLPNIAGKAIFYIEK